METFGQLIRRLRTERGETLAVVAENISNSNLDESVKISVPMLSRIETEDRHPSVRIGLEIARYFGVDPNDAMSLLAMSQVQKRMGTSTLYDRGDPFFAESSARSDSRPQSSPNLRAALRDHAQMSAPEDQHGDQRLAEDALGALEHMARQLQQLLAGGNLDPDIRARIAKRASEMARSIAHYAGN